MVKLTRIYTRGGDKGQTSLGDGTRVPKHDLRIAAYGTVDEANAAMLDRIQNDHFDLGADLCVPGGADSQPEEGRLRISQSQVDRLEAELDAMNADLEPMDTFILPGGTTAAAHLHLARTVTRRAERLITELHEQDPLNPAAIRYINRLSDHLFVLSRHLNDKGAKDLPWRPGAHR